MSLAPVTHPYFAVVLVTKTPFSETIAIDGHGRTEEEALVDWRQNADAAGWTPPRWWQWWRRRDSKAVSTGYSTL